MLYTLNSIDIIELVNTKQASTIDWKKDYKGEFVCPRCSTSGMRVRDKKGRTKKVFRCPKCQSCIFESAKVKLPDLVSKINWRKDYKIGDFACSNPKCNKRQMRLGGNLRGKKTLYCADCGVRSVVSINLSSKNLSQFAHSTPAIEPFLFSSDKWDLRSLNPLYDEQDKSIYANFENIHLDWFRLLTKFYTYHQCKLGKSFNSIKSQLTHLRVFSHYLAEENTESIYEISRSTIINFINRERFREKVTSDRLQGLRLFFETGTVQNWFKVSQDLIREDDLPQRRLANPNPISDTVREQIESNLYKLPDPFARIWLIAFFTAMRPNELALLKKDCLVQQGSNWKLVWWRKKVKNQHELPITRIIAKVIQQQQEYIEQLWGDKWQYLFCHYQGISKTDLSHPNLQPVKKVISQTNCPFTRSIRCLIEVLDIQDDNGSLAKFSSCLIRPTRLTQLFEQGHDLAIISNWAGHQKMATTALYYTHVSCELIEREVGHIQKALFNADGLSLRYESLPKSFWENPRAHQLNLPDDHINTPIYGYCRLPLDQSCDKFRACYTCLQHFVAIPEKLLLYIKTRDELRAKEARAVIEGADVLVEQYQRQADQLDKIIVSLQNLE